MKHNQDWTLEALTVIRGWLPFPPHSGLHSALPPGSPGKTALAAGRTTCRRHTTSNRDADFTPRSSLPLACLFASRTTNSRTKPSVKWGKGGCGLVGCITRCSRDTAGRLSPPWTRHISINLLIWQHGPRVNQNSRLLSTNAFFKFMDLSGTPKQVCGPRVHLTLNYSCHVKELELHMT